MLIIFGAKCKRCDSRIGCLGCSYSRGEGLYAFAQLTALMYGLDKDSTIEAFDDVTPTSIFESPNKLVEYFLNYYIKSPNITIKKVNSKAIITLRKQENKLLQSHCAILMDVILSEEHIIYKFANNKHNTQINSHEIIKYLDSIMPM